MLLLPAALAAAVGARTFTVSGHSSGGSMASQHLFAFSDRVTGLGHFQAAPYACSKLPRHSSVCTRDPAGGMDVEAMREYAVASAAEGKIAALSNLARTPIWVFSGGRDSVVVAEVLRRAGELYAHFSSAVTVKNLEAAQHAFIVDARCPVCNSCGTLRAPFINDCEYDMAGEMFAHLLGASVKPPAPHRPGGFVELDQARHFPRGMSARSVGMSTTGWAYVPAGCAGDIDRCRVHLVYHGCNSGADTLGDSIYKYAGFNGHAEANDIVVVYPQAYASNCWDWNGFLSDGAYDTRSGVQLGVVNSLVDSLSAPPPFVKA